MVATISYHLRERGQNIQLPSTTLPIETLHEIVLYLPRYALKPLLLFQPHPLGQIASYVFWSSLSIHLGVRNTHKRYIGSSRNCDNDELIEWHKKRSQQILQTIVEDDQFAKRVQKLKIYAPASRDRNTPPFHMDLLHRALPKLIRLRALECSDCLSMRAIIIDLPATVPHLKALSLSDCVQARDIGKPINQRIDLPPYLEQLTLCEGWYQQFSSLNLLQSSISKLHITSPHKAILTHFMAPNAMRILTHLSLVDWSFEAIDFFPSPSVFEIALRDGVNLQSLRIKARLKYSHSQYFRRYAHALPCLTELGIYVSMSYLSADWDFFPAVCDFLQPKAEQLVHLELGAAGDESSQSRLGFHGGSGCWALFKNTTSRRGKGAGQSPFPKLESLSMPLPEGKKNFSLHYSRLIPRGVTSLTLSRDDLDDDNIRTIFAASRDKKRPNWPPDLRLVCIGANRGRGSWLYTVVQMLSECVPTVRVVKIVDSQRRIYGFWTVSHPGQDESAAAAPVNSNMADGSLGATCAPWNVCEATYLSEEVLDCFGCEDTWFQDP